MPNIRHKNKAQFDPFSRRAKKIPVPELGFEIVIYCIRNRVHRFRVDKSSTPHAPPAPAPPAPVVPPAKLSPLGGLTTPPPFSVTGLCPASLGDAVPLPLTGLLSWGAAPCAWLLNALIWNGFLTGEVVLVREGSSVGEGARLLVLMGVDLGAAWGWD